jgi:LysR family transcriptional regulator, transcription activator of glutamate synthase operon
MNSMELRYITAFEAVARSCSISQAARELFISPTVVTRQIAALEDDLGIRLFHRHGRRLTLTAAGADFLGYASQILQLATRARMTINAHLGLQRGTLRVAVESNAAVLSLPMLLAGFSQRYPQLIIDISEVSPAQIRTGLVTGLYDVGLMSNAQPDPVLNITIVHQDELVLAVASNHRLSRQRSIRLQEIGDTGWIVPDTMNDLTQRILDTCRKNGYQPRIVLRGGSLATTLLGIAAGIGVSLLPERIVERAYGISGIPLHVPRLRSDIAVVTATTLCPNPAVEALTAHLLQQGDAGTDTGSDGQAGNER